MSFSKGKGKERGPPIRKVDLVLEKPQENIHNNALLRRERKFNGPSFAQVVQSQAKSLAIGWVVEEGKEKGVCVAS